MPLVPVKRIIGYEARMANIVRLGIDHVRIALEIEQGLDGGADRFIGLVSRRIDLIANSRDGHFDAEGFSHSHQLNTAAHIADGRQAVPACQ